eukprot:CAMPEP_0113905202 /NCGR_PEP_ID=MMETSP0780_2-20120614/23844_1 /TAXON_ID=652834 /ORGANISM="Palpitomonas bilix" /LENGTH=141 /DNA_ID=CAMNT_0000899231 /DNA_START=6 /DNA_END=431 /DNA_ORIENTATION=+ /assembly_acc=CAM_ASM_000599
MAEFISGTKEASALKRDDVVIWNGSAFRVRKTEMSRAGKHGSPKVHVTAVNMMSGNEKTEVYQTTQVVQLAEVEDKMYEIVEFDDETGEGKFIDDDGETVDLPVPSDLRGKAAAALEGSDGRCVIMHVCGEKALKFFMMNE